MLKFHILEGHTPIEVDLITWNNWFWAADRVVAETIVGDVRVSTVFIGLGCLFETMIFGDKYQTHCSTWEDAEAMHQHAIDLITA